MYGVGRQQQDTLGYMSFEVKVGPIRAHMSFHVLEGEASYHMILDRIWLHIHKALALTYTSVSRPFGREK